MSREGMNHSNTGHIGRSPVIGRLGATLATLSVLIGGMVGCSDPNQAGDGTKDAVVVAAPKTTSGPGEKIGIPGARAIDHAGFVVPNLEQAISFFQNVLGAAVVWRAAPVRAGSTDMRATFNADQRATPRTAMLRLGPNLNVELIEWSVAGRIGKAPPASDVGVGHLAFDVADIEVAGAHLRAKGVRLLEGPRTNKDGPNAGQASWFFLTPWGMPVELVQRPDTMPYQGMTGARLFRSPS